MISLLLILLLPVNARPKIAGSILRSYVPQNDLKFVETEEFGEVSYIEYNQKNKNVVIFLHGSRFSADTWDTTGILKRIHNHGYRSIAINLPITLHIEQRGTFLFDVVNNIVDDPKSRIVVVAASVGATFATPYVMGERRVVGYVSVGGILVEKRGSKNNVPLLMIYGENDRLLRSDPVKYREMFRDTRLRVIENEGHACYIKPESSRIFTSYLLDFLSSRAQWDKNIAPSSFKFQKRGTSPTTESEITPLYLFFFASCVTIGLFLWRKYSKRFKLNKSNYQ